MGQRWMIDVLSDLETFAANNGLPVLAQKLAETADIAIAEMAVEMAAPTLSRLGVARGTDGHGLRTGEFSGERGGRAQA